MQWTDNWYLQDDCIRYILYIPFCSHFFEYFSWISSHHPLRLRAGCWTTGQHTTCELPQVIMMPQCHGPKQHTEPDWLARLSSRHLKARHFYESSHVSCVNKTGVGTGRSFESSWIHLSHFKSLSIFHPFPYSDPFFSSHLTIHEASWSQSHATSIGLSGAPVIKEHKKHGSTC